MDNDARVKKFNPAFNKQKIRGGINYEENEGFYSNNDSFNVNLQHNYRSVCSYTK